MENRKVIGWKLSKPEYEKAARAIVDCERPWTSLIICNHKDAWYKKFEKAGVLELWFEPVYEDKPKLEVGKWYKHPHGGYWFIKEILSDTRHIIYGFSVGMSWIGECERGYPTSGPLLPATDQEIESALKKETEKKGLIKGARYNSVKARGYHCSDNQLIDEIKFYKNSRDTILYTTLGVLFYNGKWAEPIKEEVIEFPEIFGYKGRLINSLTSEHTSIKYGCFEIPLSHVKHIKPKHIKQIKKALKLKGLL